MNKCLLAHPTGDIRRSLHPALGAMFSNSRVPKDVQRQGATSWPQPFCSYLTQTAAALPSPCKTLQLQCSTQENRQRRFFQLRVQRSYFFFQSSCYREFLSRFAKGFPYKNKTISLSSSGAAKCFPQADCTQILSPAAHFQSRGILHLIGS